MCSSRLSRWLCLSWAVLKKTRNPCDWLFFLFSFLCIEVIGSSGFSYLLCPLQDFNWFWFFFLSPNDCGVLIMRQVLYDYFCFYFGEWVFNCQDLEILVQFLILFDFILCCFLGATFHLGWSFWLLRNIKCIIIYYI